MLVRLLRGAGTCTSSNVLSGVTIPAKSGLNVAVPPGTNDVTIPDLFSIDAAVPDGCQGGTFTLSPASGFVLTISTG